MKSDDPLDSVALSICRITNVGIWCGILLAICFTAICVVSTASLIYVIVTAASGAYT